MGRTGPVSTLCLDQLRIDGLGPVSLTITTAECIALAGSSGTGKTRLLRAIADLDHACGDALLDGVSRSHMSAAEWRRAVGFLTSDNAWWRPRVGDHFERIDERSLEALGLDKTILAQFVSRLSTGERQRLAVLRLTANRPRALLLDEPTANLDPDNVARMESFLASYRLKAGSPILWVTHDPQQAVRVASRALRIERGRLITESEPSR
jgi:ABC-type iron transport system FetAB ATPase subunit